MNLSDNCSDKISSIEDVFKTKKFTEEHLFVIFMTFELSKFGREKSRFEITFRATKLEELDGDDGSNEFEANFARRLKKSNNYKGMLPRKCLRYGEIGHLASRCPKKVP